MPRRRLARTTTLLAASLLALLGSGAAPGASAEAPSTAPRTVSAAAPAVTATPTTPVAGTVVETPPTRVLDTRRSLGVAGAVPGGATRTLAVAGSAGVPADATAVLLNLTVTNASRGGHVTAYPATGSVPTASSINFAAGDTVANLTLVRLAGGAIRLHNGSSAPVDLVGDVAGYVVGGGTASLPGSTVPTAPTRILDTRSGLGAAAAVPAKGTISLKVAGRAPVPGSGAGAVLLNVTAVSPVTGGHVTAWPSGEPRPNTSNLSLTAGRTIAGLVTVTLGGDGAVRLYNATAGPLSLVADVVGWVRDGEAAVSGTTAVSSPVRALDTRTGGGAPVAPGAEVSFAVPALIGLPWEGVAAAVLTVTATQPTRSGYVTAYPGGALPNASTLNFAAGRTIANSAVVKVGPGGRVVLRNRSGGTVHLVADLAGVVLADPASVAAGGQHSCALTPRGAVRCWGSTSFGALGDGTSATYYRSTPTSVTGIDEPAQKVVAGSDFGCALTVSGGVWCWGRNTYGQLGTGDTVDSSTARQVYPTGSGVLDLAAGALHACVVRDGFSVACWGRGTSGALGSSGSSSSPKAVPGVEAVRLHLGSDFSCAETTTATLSCWGHNDKGQVGSGYATTMPPTTVPGISSLDAVSAGGDHVCVVQEGTVWCWGSNALGQAGAWLGTAVVRSPQAVPAAGTGLTWVAAGAGTTCAGGPGTASCWGQNPYGITGPDTTTSPEKPRPMPSLATARTVVLGAKQGCAVNPHASVSCWGQSEFGQVGDGLDVRQLTGVPVAGLGSGVTAMSSGPTHRCAVRTGEVWCWGRDADGELGDGARNEFPSGVPVRVTLPHAARAVAAGGTWASRGYSCAALDDDSVWCWGDNTSGVLGDGTTTSSVTPVQVQGIAGPATALTAGASAACALLQGGTVQCWGDGGQVGSTGFTRGVPATVALGAPAVAVSAGDQHACAVLTDHTVWCWGSGSSGQLGDGGTTGGFLPVQVAGLPAATGVSAGANHTCAVTDDGAVWCWGANNRGQVAPGSSSTSPVLAATPVAGLPSPATEVSADGEHSCALLASGSARCWGYNAWGQTGTGYVGFTVVTPSAVVTPADGIAHLDGGWWNECALGTDGAVTCWGARRWWLGDGTSSFYLAPRRVVGL